MPRKQKPIIVHLNVRQKDLQNDAPVYNPNISDPQPMQSSSTMMYENFSPIENTIIRVGANTEIMECNTEYKDTRIYPRNSKTVCWWDGHYFSNKPCLIPKGICKTHSNGEIEYDTYGNCCSPECALAYLENEPDLDPEVRWGRIVLLHKMTQHILNSEKTRIRAALPRWTLKEYGGAFTIEKYRELNTTILDSCELIYPPITVDIPILKMDKKDHIVKNPQKVVIREERFLEAEKNLREKIKPKKIERKGILDLMNIQIEN